MPALQTRVIIPSAQARALIRKMLYLSQVLGRPILDLDGERVATLRDVIVRLGEEDHPPVSGFVARYRRRDFFLPRWRIGHFAEDGVRLNSDILDLRSFMRSGRPVEVIDWADVGYLATDAATVQLKSRRGKLARLHPVEIARLAE